MTHVCKACGHEDTPVKRSPSNFAVEVLVWIAALILAASVHWVVLLGAFAFSLWRFASARRVCRKCGSAEVIPSNSPIGQQLTRKP